jgi:hypothetical protein
MTVGGGGTTIGGGSGKGAESAQHEKAGTFGGRGRTIGGRFTGGRTAGRMPPGATVPGAFTDPA